MSLSFRGMPAGARRVNLLGAGLVLGVLGIAVAQTAGAQTAAAPTTPVSADQVVQIALQQNPDVLSAAQDIKLAGGVVTSAYSAIFPNLSLSQDYFHTNSRSGQNARRDPSTGALILPKFDLEGYSGGLNLTQTIVSFPAWAGIRSAKASKEATTENTSATRAFVALQAYTQFYTLLKAIKLTTVARQTLQLTQDQLKRTQALFELGSVAKGDVLKQQVQVSQSQLDEINARSAIEVERARLISFLGFSPGQSLEIDTTLSEGNMNVDSSAVWRDAFTNRAELVAARADVRSAEAGLGGAQGRRYPTLTGSASYSFDLNNHFPDSFNELDDNSSRNLSLRFNLPIFDGRSAKGQIQQAKARKLQAAYALRREELVIAVEVKTALQAAYQARERVQVARDGQASAEEDLKLSQEKYNVGSATVLELIDAQVALTRARSDYISALADAQVAQMQLRRARGERF